MQQVIQPAAQINENDVATCIIFELDWRKSLNATNYDVGSVGGH